MKFEYPPIILGEPRQIELPPHLLSGDPMKNERRNRMVSRLERKIIRKDLQVYESTYATPIQTEHSVNNIGRIRHFKSESKSSVIVLPKRGTYGYKFDELIARYLATNGMNAYTIETPYHGSRRIQNITGGMPTDLEKLYVAFQQAITETMSLVDLIKEESRNGKIGICGISLGGSIASVVYGTSDVDSAFLLMPAGNYPELFLKSGDGFMKYFRSQQLKSMSEGQLKNEVGRKFAIFEPCTHANPDKKDNLVLVKATLDKYVPSECFDALRESWGNPKTYSIPLGHRGIALYLPFLLHKILKYFERTLA